MSESKHTPTPWEYGGVAKIATTFDREVAIYPPHHSLTGGYQYAGPIAVVAVSEDAGGEANARLMWAAPDMLEALLLARAFGSQGDTHDGLSVSDFIDLAIAKATTTEKDR